MNNQVIFHISKFTHRLMPSFVKAILSWTSSLAPSHQNQSFLSSFPRTKTQTHRKFQVRHEIRSDTFIRHFRNAWLDFSE